MLENTPNMHHGNVQQHKIFFIINLFKQFISVHLLLFSPVSQQYELLSIQWSFQSVSYASGERPTGFSTNQQECECPPHKHSTLQLFCSRQMAANQGLRVYLILKAVLPTTVCLSGADFLHLNEVLRICLEKKNPIS